IRFSPQKPFELDRDIAVTVKDQGQWRFPVQFQATVPSPDDTIFIDCVGSQQASVLFYLTSCQEEPAAFCAEFRDATPELYVEPKDGILQPRGSAGTAFRVTFRPSELGKAVTNVLRIETKDDFWSYAILGRQAHSTEATCRPSDGQLAAPTEGTSHE
ncbi:flagellar associated protein, partial [Cystoisospora suis]